MISHNKIMVHNVKYNGLTFLNSPYFRPEGGFLCLKEFSFFEVATSASTEKYAIRHGEYVSPTLKKNRRVRILFDIIANSEEERWSLLKQVQRAFTPEQNPSPFNENLWKDLQFEDVNGDIWKAKCQVVQGVQLSDFANEKRVGISVELITDSSEFKSNEEQSITGGRNTRMGKKLGTDLGFYWQFYREVIDYQGVIDSPMEIKLEVVADNPCPNKRINLIHEWTGQKEGLQISNIESLQLQTGDIITINTDTRNVTLSDGDATEDITGMVALGSQRPLLKLGENIIAVDTGAVEKTIDVTIKRNEVF